jgi:O-antigen ligase
MLKRWGIENSLDGVIFLSLILLVAITPLGSEATHPIVLGLYRTLLFLILVVSAIRTRQYDLPQVCYLFLGASTVVLLAMYGSAVLRPVAHFEGVYVFYKNALFLAAFVSLASFHRTRSASWKNAVLALVVVIDLVYLAAAWIMTRITGIQPLIGPFVNPNYFASFLVVGFAVCVAGSLYVKAISVRIAAAAAGLILFIGIGQTSSRAAFLSVLAVLSVAFYRTAKLHKIAIWRIAVIAILIAVIAAALSPTLLRKFTDRGQRDVYNYERTQIWMETLSMIATHPVLGVGTGRFYYVSKLFTPAVDGAIGRYRKWPNIAHSEYLQYMAELGIPIALLMFAIGAYLFRLTWQRSESVAPDSRIFQEVALLAATGLGIHALVDNNWTVPVVAAGLAVISLADVLPYRPWPFVMEWTPVKKAALLVFSIAVFAQAVKIPTLGLYFNEVGHQAFLAGNFERAEKMHRLGLGFVPDHPVMLDNLGMVYFDAYIKTRKTEYLDRAESLFQDSMTANPSFDIPAGHLETALLQRLTGNLSKDKPIHALVVSADRLSLKANPYNPFVRKNLAEALYNLGQKEEAIDELRTAVIQEPNYVQGFTRLAQWEEEAGNPGEAAVYRRKANDVVVHFKDQATPDPFEALLLDRPTSNTGKP